MLEDFLAALGGGVQPVAQRRGARTCEHFFGSLELGFEPAECGFEVVGVVEKDVAPEGAVAAGDSCGVEEAFAADGQGGLGLHGDEGGGDQMGKVADVGEEAVVALGGEALRAHAEELPEFFDLSQGGGVGLLVRREDAEAIVEEVGAGEFYAALFAAGDGVTGDEIYRFGEIGRASCRERVCLGV